MVSEGFLYLIWHPPLPAEGKVRQTKAILGTSPLWCAFPTNPAIRSHGSSVTLLQRLQNGLSSCTDLPQGRPYKTGTVKFTRYSQPSEPMGSATVDSTNHGLKIWETNKKNYAVADVYHVVRPMMTISVLDIYIWIFFLVIVP